MIEKVKWDSDFFNFPIGSLKVNDKTDWNLDEYLAVAQKFKLIYIFSKKKLNPKSKLKLVDRKVVYSKKIDPIIYPIQEINEFDIKYHNYSDLLELGYLSGAFSRFKLDENFTEEDFKKLYKKWIDNSINEEIAFKIFIITEFDKIAGFVTLQRKNSRTTRIGLIAVNPDFQGKKIASKLINKCESISFNLGYEILEVSTQYKNIAARNLYMKNNFKIKSMEFIYHLWNK
jgi:dTDP-4-amino-4,6-dideoxy-D-galactose acyltransferase